MFQILQHQQQAQFQRQIAPGSMMQQTRMIQPQLNPQQMSQQQQQQQSDPMLRELLG